MPSIVVINGRLDENAAPSLNAANYSSLFSAVKSNRLNPSSGAAIASTGIVRARVPQYAIPLAPQKSCSFDELKAETKNAAEGSGVIA